MDSILNYPDIPDDPEEKEMWEENRPENYFGLAPLEKLGITENDLKEFYLGMVGQIPQNNKLTAAERRAIRLKEEKTNVEVPTYGKAHPSTPPEA